MYVAYNEETKEVIATSERIEYLDMYTNEYGVCHMDGAGLGAVDGLWYGDDVTHWEV